MRLKSAKLLVKSVVLKGSRSGELVWVFAIMRLRFLWCGNPCCTAQSDRNMVKPGDLVKQFLLQRTQSLGWASRAAAWAHPPPLPAGHAPGHPLGALQAAVERRHGSRVVGRVVRQPGAKGHAVERDQALHPQSSADAGGGDAGRFQH